MATGHLPFTLPTAPAGENSERTPLLPPIAFGYDSVPQNFRPISQCNRLWRLIFSALRFNWAKMLVALTSSLWCWRVGPKENQWMFTLSFAGLMTVLSVNVVLRHARGNERRTRALQTINKLFAAFWAIYTFLPKTTRRKVRDSFLESFKAVAHHISAVASGDQYWYSIMGLAPAFHKLPSSDTSWLRNLPGKKAESGSDELACEAGLCPRIKLLCTLMLVDELDGTKGGDGAGQGRAGQHSGYSWHHKLQILECYDELIALVIPSVSRFQAAFHNFCFLLVVLLLPWAFPDKYLRRMSPAHIVGHKELSIGMFLFANTIVATLLLTIIDTLMEASETPFSQEFMHDQISLEECVDVLKISISGYEKRLHTAEGT